MIKRRKFTKSEEIAALKQINRTKIELECDSCGTLTPTTSDISKIICSNCVALMVPPPETSKTNSPAEKRPRGWQFRKQYVSPSGIEYSFGKEVSKNEDSTENSSGVKESIQ